MTKILAIDDDLGNLDVIKATLRRYIPETQVFVAQSGSEGIRTAQRELPDTILLDIMMPEVDGYEVCKILKSGSSTKHIPIIFFSAYAKESKQIIKGLDMGADAFLEKPIEPAELAAQLRVMLRIKKAEDNLKKEVYKYRIMAETLPDALVMINLDEEITFISPIALELFGYDKDSKLLLENAYKIMFAEKQEIAREMLNQVLLVGMVKDVEILLKRKDGSSFMAEVSASLVIDEKDDAEEFIIVIKDISIRKNAEQEILNYQKSLKSLNASLSKTEERERKTIAGYLHDGIGQTLSLAHINLSSLEKIDFPIDAKKVIEESTDLINNAIKETRTLTFDLSPPILFELGIIPAFEWKLKQVEEKFEFKTSLITKEPALNLTNETRILLYRIFCELLANIVKHAQASSIGVEYFWKEDRLNIAVKDDGKGFEYNPEANMTERGGFGLFSIRERLDTVQGNLIISSTKKKGTIALISIPIKNI